MYGCVFVLNLPRAHLASLIRVKQNTRFQPLHHLLVVLIYISSSARVKKVSVCTFEVSRGLPDSRVSERSNTAKSLQVSKDFYLAD